MRILDDYVYEKILKARDLSMSDEVLQQVITRTIAGRRFNYMDMRLIQSRQPEQKCDNVVTLTQKLSEMKLDLISLYLQALYEDKLGGKILNPITDKLYTIDELKILNELSNTQIQHIIEKQDKDDKFYKLISTINKKLDFKGIGSEHENSKRGELMLTADPLMELATLGGDYNCNDKCRKIYLNPPSNLKKQEFLYLYVQKCITNRVPIMYKGEVESDTTKEADKTTIYSNSKNFSKVIKIVEEIFKERPDIKESFGSPVVSTAHVIDEDGKSYYGIASNAAPIIGGSPIDTINDFWSKTFKTSFTMSVLGIFIKRGIDSINGINIKDIYNILLENPLATNGISRVSTQAARLLKDKLGNITPADINLEEVRYLMKRNASYFRYEDFEHLDVPLWMAKDFYEEKVNTDKVKNENRQPDLIDGTKSNEEKYNILFNTETLFQQALDNYMNSNLSREERTIEYIKATNELRRKFQVDSALQQDFKSSIRYFEVCEFMKSIPLFEPFKKDEAKGSGINFVLEKKYYDSVAASLDQYVNTQGLNNPGIKM